MEVLEQGDSFDAWTRWDTRPRGRWRKLRATARAATELARQRSRLQASSAQLRAIQDERVRGLVTHAYRYVPHYRELLRRHGLEPRDFQTADDLRKLPLLTPDELRSDPERFMADDVDVREVAVAGTSGTSGKPRGVMLRSERALVDSLVKGERDRALIVKLAGESYPLTLLPELLGKGRAGRLADRLLDPRGCHRRVSIYGAISSGAGERNKWSKRTLVPAQSARHHRLRADMPLPDAVEAFRRIRPRISFSFGAYAEQFLRHVAAEEPDAPLPRVWAFVGDAVGPRGRDAAAELGVRLWSGYSAVEVGRIGWQCEQGEGHHLEIDSRTVRVVDEDGRDLPPGESGRLVVSNLVNDAMVVLNYVLGDVGALAAEPCACGRAAPLLAQLRGRVTDHLRFADGRVLSSLVIDSLLRWQLRDAHYAQFEQVGEDRIAVHLVADPGRHERIRGEIVTRAAEVFPGTDVEVLFNAEPVRRGTDKPPAVLPAAAQMQPRPVRASR